MLTYQEASDRCDRQIAAANKLHRRRLALTPRLAVEANSDLMDAVIDAYNLYNECMKQLLQNGSAG